MRIVHLCLGAFYPDRHSYQENMLPKFHRQMGYDVEVIASTQTFDGHGRVCYLPRAESYQNEYDIRVTRLPYRGAGRVWKKLKRYRGTLAALEAAGPDVLFIHGCQFLDIDQVVRYLKAHRRVRVFVDNHADFTNSATNWFSRNILHKVLWRRCAHRIAPWTEVFYGVLPSRVDFLRDVYRLPAEQCELLVMGADDERCEEAKRDGARARIRAERGIAPEDFLVVTGGKIDRWKTQTLLLMEAVQGLAAHVRLLVFGSVTPELEERVRSLADGVKVQYVGWIDARDTYNYLEAADLAVFPGRHSVLWEQAAGQGVPLLVRDWPGTHHVDVGGNARFLREDTAAEIAAQIKELADRGAAYQTMLAAARGKGRETFSYRGIARRSIARAVSAGPRRVAFVVEGYPTQKDPLMPFVRELIVRMADSGLACDVIAPQSLTRALAHRLPLRPRHWVDRAEDGRHVDVYQPVYLSLSRFGKSLAERSRLRAARRAWRRLKRPVDCLYAHFWHMAVVASQIDDALPIFVACGESRISVRDRFAKARIDEMQKRLRGAIYVSDKSRREAAALELGVNAPALVAPNGFDPSIFRPLDRDACRRELGWPQDVFALAFVGAFTKRKGADRTQRAIERLAPSCPKLRACFLGAGELAPSGDFLLYSGSVPHREIPRYLSACDVFVLPTTNEGCCNAIVEALACGLPVISARADFNSDILDESCAILIDPMDEEAIAEAIRTLATDGDLCRRLAAGAREKAQALDIDRRCRNILDFLAEHL